MSESNAAENLPQDEATAAEGGDVAAMETRVKELENQLAEMRNEALRHLADAENTRKRAAKEREDTSKYAVAKLARELLDVADNLNRALQAVKPEQREADPAIKNLFTGVEATERQLLAVFERMGIRRIEALGQAFDPNLHQVVTEVDAPEKAPGTIVQVLQVGYVIHDRLLREAMVAVARGGSAPQSVDQKI